MSRHTPSPTANAQDVTANTSRASVGQPGYVPYCGGCSTMMRMHRDEVKEAFVCRSCGLETRRVNGEDMFDRTAPQVQS